MGEINNLDLVETPTSISRRFIVEGDVPIIGKLLVPGLVEGRIKQGVIETSKPCPSEISIITTLERDIRAGALYEDDACALLIAIKLHVSGHFDNRLLSWKPKFVPNNEL